MLTQKKSSHRCPSQPSPIEPSEDFTFAFKVLSAFQENPKYLGEALASFTFTYNELRTNTKRDEELFEFDPDDSNENTAMNSTQSLLRDRMQPKRSHSKPNNTLKEQPAAPSLPQPSAPIPVLLNPRQERNSKSHSGKAPGTYSVPLTSPASSPSGVSPIPLRRSKSHDDLTKIAGGYGRFFGSNGATSPSSGNASPPAPAPAPVLRKL